MTHKIPPTNQMFTTGDTTKQACGVDTASCLQGCFPSICGATV